MIALKTARPPDTDDTLDPPRDRDFLSRRISDLALQERDAVRRRDWSDARLAAEERASLQAVRQRAGARRLA